MIGTLVIMSLISDLVLAGDECWLPDFDYLHLQFLEDGTFFLRR